MITEWLISVPKADDPVWDEQNPKPTFLVRLGEYGTNWVYFDHAETSPLLMPEFATSKLLGNWDFDGNLLSPLDDDYYLIRPLGNQTITQFDADGNPIGTLDNVATQQLEYSHGFGWRQRQLQETPAVDTLPLYPADTQPITLTMARRFDDTPAFEGEGWVATIEFSDPTRDPSVRAIAIYDQNWNYLYTTGAFVLTEVEPETTGPDGETIPAVFKWQTENPAGRVTPTPEPIYYALLWASLQEGRMTLTETQDSRVDLFWDQEQDGGQQPAAFSLVYHPELQFNGELVEYEGEAVTYG